MMSEKIINILNQDEKAKELIRSFYQAMEKHGQDMTAEEKEDAERFMMMLAIIQNSEAMDVMTEQLYHNLRS